MINWRLWLGTEAEGGGGGHVPPLTLIKKPFIYTSYQCRFYAPPNISIVKV